jgi:integrase
MNAALAWRVLVEDYLIYRHSLGFVLRGHASLLRQFAQFAEQQRQNRLTIALVVAWARSIPELAPGSWRFRLHVLRGFAKYLLRFDPATEIPPNSLFGPATYHRRVPHIFSHEEIVTLMDAAGGLNPPKGLRSQTCRTLFGLLASTGLRISEALNLRYEDVDLDGGVLTIRETKFYKSRIVPLDPSVVAALKSYARSRNRKTLMKNNRFFLFDNGRPPSHKAMLFALRRLCKQLGWLPRGEYPYHRLMDIRHTFIVRNILRFYQQGIDIDRAILALSTYVGHDHVADTYWYCTAIPELMAIATERFHRYSYGERL